MGIEIKQLKQIKFLRLICLGILLVLLESCMVPAARVNSIMENAYRTNGGSELYIAIQLQNLSKIRQLVSMGADIENVLMMKKGASQYVKQDLYLPALQIANSSYLVATYSKDSAKILKSRQIIVYLLQQGADLSGIYSKESYLDALDKTGALTGIYKPYRNEIKQAGSLAKNKSLSNNSKVSQQNAMMEKAFRKNGGSDLYIAIQLLDSDRVQQLILNGADMEQVLVMKKGVSEYVKQDLYQTALQISSTSYLTAVYLKDNTKKQQSITIIKHLLEQGANTSGTYSADSYLNAIDKTGTLVALFKPYKTNNGFVAKKADDIAIKNEVTELNRMKQEIAALKASIKKNKGTVIPIPIATLSESKYNKYKSRTALVIGNSNYSYSRLANPRNDARDIAITLKSLDFKVILKVDVNQRQMEEAIDEFSNQLSQGGVGLFYYAGHGIQYKDSNYLIPLGAKIKKQKDLRYEAVNLGRVLDGMGAAGTGLNIAILDACRDNPLPRSYRSSGTRGLIKVPSPDGTILAFSTSPGAVAQDGDGRNGLYTTYLLKHLKTKNISIDNLLKRVSKDVKKASGRGQKPWRESSFDGDFYF